jgi:GTPase Era involved in 16S rRNA processing
LLIEKIYSKDVYIDLIVKVNENWKNDIQILKKIGFVS